MKRLTVEIPDELHERLERRASRAGQKVEELVVECLERGAPQEAESASATPDQEGEGGLERWFGIWNSGDPDSANNERIDADLAREYGNLDQRKG